MGGKESGPGRPGVSGVALGLLALGAQVVILPAQQSKPLVEARMVMEADAVRTGGEVKAAVVAQIASGYHVNDHKPSLDYLIPTELKLEPPSELTVKQIVYPRGVSQKLAFSDSPLSVYEGTLVLGALIKVAPATPPGTFTLKGKLNYQACNDHACFPPASAPVSLTVKVVGRKEAVKSINEDVFRHLEFD